MNKVLVLAPHTDDGEMGAGGTISYLLEKGSEVYYAAFSTAEHSLPPHLPLDTLRKEVKTATKRLGIKEENLFIFNYRVRELNYHRQSILEDMIKLRKNHGFDLVLMPSLCDIHQDHVTIAQEGLRAFKTTSILGYELPWNNLSFNTTCFTRLEKRHVENKAWAVAEYKSQASRPYMDLEFIYSLARTRGVQAGSEYAEAFEVLRWML